MTGADKKAATLAGSPLDRFTSATLAGSPLDRLDQHVLECTLRSLGSSDLRSFASASCACASAAQPIFLEPAWQATHLSVYTLLTMNECQQRACVLKVEVSTQEDLKAKASTQKDLRREVGRAAILLFKYFDSEAHAQAVVVGQKMLTLHTAWHTRAKLGLRPLCHHDVMHPKSIRHLGCALEHLRREEEAIAVYQQAIDARKDATPGSQDEVDKLSFMRGLGVVLSVSRMQLAEAVLRNALARMDELLAINDDDRVETLYRLGRVLYNLSRHAEAQPLIDEAAALYVDSNNTERAASALQALGVCESDMCEHDHAVEHLRRAVELHIDVYGHESDRVNSVRFELARALFRSGEENSAGVKTDAEAEGLFRHVVAAATANSSQRNDTLLPRARKELFNTLVAREKYAEAEGCGCAVLEKLITERGRNGMQVADVLGNLAKCAYKLGRLAEAVPMCREALSLMMAAGGDEQATKWTRQMLVRLLDVAGQDASQDSVVRRAFPESEVGWLDEYFANKRSQSR